MKNLYIIGKLLGKTTENIGVPILKGRKLPDHVGSTSPRNVSRGLFQNILPDQVLRVRLSPPLLLACGRKEARQEDERQVFFFFF